MKRVLFLCSANVCRSVMAEGFCKQKAGKTIQCSSAGFGVEGVGASPDASTVKVMLERGVDVSQHSASLVYDRDLSSFDLVLAMGEGNKRSLLESNPELQGKVHTLKGQ